MNAGRRYWLPNAVTLARLLAVPVAVYLLSEEAYGAAFWVFVLAGLSDALDGFLAKRLGAVSRFGAYLDPLADKALLVAIYVTLGVMGQIADWLVMLIVFRDVLIVGGALFYHTLTGRGFTVRPLKISKLNTVAQIVLAGVVLGKLGMGVQIPWLKEALVYLVAVTTFASGAAYVWTWMRRAFILEEDKP